MSIRTQLALAAAAWLLGFVLLRGTGSVLFLFGFAVALTIALLATDPATRRLLAPKGLPFAIGAGAAGVMIAATYLLYPVCKGLWRPLGVEVSGLYGLLFHGLGRPLVAAVVVIMSACEEVLFRGRLLSRSPRLRAPAQLGLVAGFYAIVHVASGSPTLVALAFLCGLFWGLLRILTDSLWTSIVCHVAWDLAIMIIAPLA